MIHNWEEWDKKHADKVEEINKLKQNLSPNPERNEFWINR